jgi:hypothetical protein
MLCRRRFSENGQEWQIKVQLGSPKSIKKRNESLLIKNTKDGAIVKRRGAAWHRKAIASTVNVNATRL